MSITLRSRRGAIGTSWQAVALREAIEAILGVGRASGGKATARAGRVQWLDVDTAVARGDVLADDGELYQARIDLPAFEPPDRHAFVEVARAHPELPALLSAGEYPRGIEAELARSEVSLLPRGPSELSHDCSCLDWPGPCRHVAALAYVLVEEVDAHPRRLLTLRGLTLEDLVTPDGPAPAEDPTSARRPEPAAFDPSRAEPALLAEVIGEQAAAVVTAFYRSGTGPDDDLQ